MIEKFSCRSRNGLLAWERCVVEKCLSPPGRLLDIGCGAGREALALAGLGFRVTGVDISLELIEQARRNAAAKALSIDFQCCNGTSLSFAGRSFDYVLMPSQVLGNVPRHRDRLALLREARRVLADGGMLVFSAHNRATCEPIAREQGLIADDQPGDLEEGDSVLAEKEGACYWHYFTDRELRSLVEAAELEILDIGLARDFGQDDWDTVWVCICRKPQNGDG